MDMFIIDCWNNIKVFVERGVRRGGYFSFIIKFDYGEG